MSNDALIAGTVLILLLVLESLPPSESLHPSRRTRWVLGFTGGVASVASFMAPHWNAPELGLLAYPTVVAFLGLYFGALPSAVAGVISLVPVAYLAPNAAPAAAAVLCGTGVLALGWRFLGQRLSMRGAAWLVLAGLAVTLPMVVALLMMLINSLSGGRGPWELSIPWHHGAGMLILGAGRLLLASKARAELARNSTQQALLQREKQLQLAMDAVGGGRWEWDVAEQRFYCHGLFYHAFGITQADADAPDLWQRWYARRHTTDIQRNAEKLARTMNGLEESYEAQFRALDMDGQWRWIMSRGTVVRRDARGRPVRLVGMDVDVTAHREVEDALRSSEAKYTTFYQTLPDPAGISRISDGCYVDVNPALCELLGLPREQIVGRTSTELRIWASDEERARLLEVFRRDGQVERLPMMAQSKGRRIPGLMSARSVMIGADSCFVFVFHDMTEAHRSAEELRALNNQLQQAGRLARLGVWEEERGKGLVYWSDVSMDILGLPHGTPPPSDYIDRYVAPPYREPLREVLRKSMLSGSEWTMEMEVIHADGRLVWVRARGEPEMRNGRAQRMRGVTQDIDESKRAEQRLRLSEDRFSRIFQLMPFPMGLTNRDTGRYVDLNPAWVEVAGIPRDEAIGRTAVELGLCTPEDRQRLLENIDHNGLPVSTELQVNVRGGPPRTVLQSMRPTEFDGEPCWLFSVHDITDRKRNEERVREREELLSLTISAASLGLWDWDLHLGTVTGDSRWRAMYNLPDGPDAPPAVRWKDTLAIDDSKRIEIELVRHQGNPSTPFDATCRIDPADGRAVRWVHNLGKIVGFDADGAPRRMLGVAIDVTPQREQEVLLQRLALYDALTGLPNRVLLARTLQESMNHARKTGSQLGVAYLDLDGFKPVNDLLGHTMGDRLLVVVAERLTRSLRPRDCVARLGGDEFVILMPDLQSVGDCEAMLRRVMESISAFYTLDTERIMVTASIGFTMFPTDDADADALLRHADQAMYAAKQAGRKRDTQFDAAQERAAQQRREQTRHLRDALAGAQFTLYLQPKVEMQTGAVVGA
ncbi:MAG: diguanylate cyclase domain-containing protein, partial [Acidovorax sp.]